MRKLNIYKHDTSLSPAGIYYSNKICITSTLHLENYLGIVEYKKETYSIDDYKFRGSVNVDFTHTIVQNPDHLFSVYLNSLIKKETVSNKASLVNELPHGYLVLFTPSNNITGFKQNYTETTSSGKTIRVFGADKSQDGIGYVSNTLNKDETYIAFIELSDISTRYDYYTLHPRRR